jgi:hypothetical protein
MDGGRWIGRWMGWWMVDWTVDGTVGLSGRGELRREAG